VDDNCDGSVDEGFLASCGLGACAASSDVCGNGLLVACVPGTPLASADTTCDGVDDDCDGSIDENCATCVKVSRPAQGGNDTQAAIDSNLPPFATIQAAIDWTAADATRPKVVCVAANNCSRTLYDETVTVPGGVSVLGSYQNNHQGRCAFTFNNTNGGQAVDTVIRGAIFSGNTQPSSLDGFEIARIGGDPAIGVAIDSSVGVVLGNLDISRGPAVATTIGVDVSDNSAVVLTNSSVHGGNGTALAVGVRVVDSRIDLRDNCEAYDANGRCNSFCGTNSLRGIRGRHDTGAQPESHAIVLQNAPGSLVDRTAVCGAQSSIGSQIKITGDATGTVLSASLLNGWGGDLQSYGLWLEDCGGASPWIVDNFRIAATGLNHNTDVAAVRAVGDCHPVIEDNVLIVGGGEGNASEGRAIHCLANASGSPSRCTVLDNTLLQGSEAGFPPSSVGVRCDDGSCVRIAGNRIDARAGLVTRGVILDNTGAVLENNVIDASCGNTESIGVLSLDSWSRMENNLMTGGFCQVGDPNVPFIGLKVVASASGNEVDVHSNVIDAGPNPAAVCFGDGVLLESDTTSPPTRPLGVFRNNVLLGSNCSTAYLFREADATADPRVLQNNVFDDRNSRPSAFLYRDEGSTDENDINTINGYSDVNALANAVGSCTFVSYPTDLHLDAGDTLCADQGTASGAPATDFEGDPRSDGTPDVGIDER